MAFGHHPQLFLGIEGGGTRSVALVSDRSGQTIERLESGPANLRLLTDQALRQQLRTFSRKMPRPDAIAIGLAGLRTDADRLRVLSAAAEVWPSVPCVACSDLETALAAAAPPAPGEQAQVLVLSGTGSCCYGRARRGRTAKMGGWGHLLGDKGSAYEIGLRALKAVVYYYDRDGVWSALGARLLARLELNAPDDLIGWTQEAEKKDIAALALEVFEAAGKRDRIASDILAGAADSLAKDAASCARRLVSETSPVQFVFAGSVLLKQPRFAGMVTKRLAERWPNLSVVGLEREGVWGAVQLARDLAAKLVLPELKAAARTRTPTPAPVLRSNPDIRLPEATALSPTECRNPRSAQLDRMSLRSAVRVMLEEEATVPVKLLERLDEIEACVRLVATALRNGGRLFYVGAGTSGRLGVLDASECPPTFRTSPDQVQGIIAGGAQALWRSIEGAEDDATAGAAAVRFRGAKASDVVVGIAASGRTPFVWGALAAAKSLGAKTILVSFNPHLKIPRKLWPTRVFAVDLGPEILTGSTRLKAGTATKLILNLFTTLTMVQLGKVVGNLMVDLNPSNVKLRGRAVRIVRELTGASESDAQRALERAGWVVKKALAFAPSRARRSAARERPRRP